MRYTQADVIRAAQCTVSALRYVENDLRVLSGGDGYTAKDAVIVDAVLGSIPRHHLLVGDHLKHHAGLPGCLYIGGGRVLAQLPVNRPERLYVIDVRQIEKRIRARLERRPN